MGEPTIRRAQPDEADALTELALRAKASWGYDEDFIVRCKDSLTITGDEIHHYPVFVVTIDEVVCGYYALAIEPPESLLLALFIEPDHVRQGLGFRLFGHATATARAIGCTSMMIESDPNAEPFYVRMGAHRAGEVESDVESGRMLPLMRFDMR
jgi:GNAT superfamily N-acetyltransferase